MVATNNEQQRLCRPRRRPGAAIKDLTARGRQVSIDFTEPTNVVPHPTPARGLQVAAALVDKLQATLGDPNLLAVQSN